MPPTSGENTTSLLLRLVARYWKKTGEANRWSTGMSKKPWICWLCRSIASTRFAPRRHEEIGHQLGGDRHARLVLAVLPGVAVERG